MNELIRQLAEQAGSTHKQNLGVYQFYKDELEKFVVLIIKECIDIAQDRANFPGFPPNDVNDIIDEIREHFGVEE